MTSNENKEIAIYNAVSELLAEGYILSNLTISEIAAAAGIGKGTIYEYFNTKEELLRRAITFHLKQELAEMQQQIEQHDHFKDRLYALFRFIDQYRTCSISLLRMVIPDITLQEVMKVKQEEVAAFQHFITNLLDEFLERGRQEGLFKAADKTYCHFALISIIGGYVHYTCGFPQITPATLVDDAYQVLLKALN